MSKGLPSSKEIVVLRLLRDAPSSGMYGLELVNESDGLLGRASIYVILSRMEEKGLVKSRTPQSDGHPGLPRPRYRITALGQKGLQATEAAQTILHGSIMTRLVAR